MSDLTQHTGSIINHDLFINEWDDTYQPHAKRFSITVLDAILKKENIKPEDLLVVLPYVSSKGIVLEARSYAFKSTAIWNHAYLVSWAKDHPYLKDVPPDSPDFDKKVGEMVWMSIIERNMGNPNPISPESKPRLEYDDHDNAFCYIYQGWKGLICPYTFERIMVPVHHVGLKILYDRIVGTRIVTE